MRKHGFSPEEARDYFVLDRVFEAMFKLAAKIFNIDIEEISEFDGWHPQVRLFAARRDKKILGYFYCDLYARAHKRGGAWMDENRQRRKLLDGSLQLPIAYLICNFSPRVGNKPTLLLHDEILVLFHEFGHCLHHLLTQIECRGVSGIAGVPHDMVELPSQVMENWCWNEEFFGKIAVHYETGAPFKTTSLTFKRAQFSKWPRNSAPVGIFLI